MYVYVLYACRHVLDACMCMCCMCMCCMCTCVLYLEFLRTINEMFVCMLMSCVCVCVCVCVCMCVLRIKVCPCCTCMYVKMPVKILDIESTL